VNLSGSINFNIFFVFITTPGRLYLLRNQLVQGGATYKSKINQAQIRDANSLLKLLPTLIIDIMMDYTDEDWGKIYYPVLK
jgi:hypothetical protein